MVWLQRGLCGLDFKRQTSIIGISHLFVTFLVLIYGFIFIGNPQSIVGESYVPAPPAGDEPTTVGNPGSNDDVFGNGTTTTAAGNLTEISTPKPATTNASSVESELDREKEEEVSVAESPETAEKIENGEIASDERKHYESMLQHVQNQGMEMVVGSIISTGLTILLLIGSRQEKSIYFVPWLTEQTVGLIVVSVVGVIKLIGGRIQVSAGFVVLFLLLFVLFTFFTYAVMSHFMMLRKMKQHSRDIINSVMQGSGYRTGVNYDRLRDELGQARELQEVGPGSLSQGPDDGKTKRDDLLYFSI